MVAALLGFFAGVLATMMIFSFFEQDDVLIFKLAPPDSISPSTTSAFIVRAQKEVMT